MANNLLNSSKITETYLMIPEIDKIVKFYCQKYNTDRVRKQVLEMILSFG